jgi:oxygen-independent coproporphyrinogen-3 oxidase
MIKALCVEIELRKDLLKNEAIQSLYFGGGTPSILDPSELSSLVEKVHSHFTISNNAEVTIEANPDDINVASLKVWREMGINRLSIGVQSFNAEELKWMNRAHTSEQSVRSVLLAQDLGFENITIDLIYGSKFQNEKSWKETLQKAIDLNTPHISSYNLTIEERTVLGSRRKKKEEPPVSDELSSLQFNFMSEFLSQNGFLHYEISNFAKEGSMAVHNSNYWKRKKYLGIGPSAHSYDGNERQWNVSNNENYIRYINSGEKFYETEILSTENKFNEYIMTGLRTIFGCDRKEMEELFGKERTGQFIKEVSKKKEFVSEDKGIYRLNAKGKLYADKIASDLFIS